jgi:hypothetical protein
VIAGMLLFVASAGMLMGFITGEAVYPAAYSTSHNTRSAILEEPCRPTAPESNLWAMPVQAESAS